MAFKLFSKTIDVDACIELIENALYERLKEYGFKRYGETLHRFVSEDISQVISFQGGQALRNESHLLWVNIGIRVPECFERQFDVDHPEEYYHDYECNMRTKLGIVKYKDQNKIRSYDLRKNPDRITADIWEELLTQVLPVFEILNSRENILAHRREYPWFDMVNAQEILLEECMIYGHLGDKGKAAECFEMYYYSLVSGLSEDIQMMRQLEYVDKLRTELEW